jgi:hypothetical protein
MVGKPRPATLEVAGQNEFNANSKLIRPSALCWLSQKLGLVASLAPPGGSATGFAVFDYDVGRKWLQLLKEIAPRVTRAAVLRDPAISQGIGQLGASSQYRRQRGRGEPVDIRDAGEIERAITAFARVSNSGLIVTGSPICLVKPLVAITGECPLSRVKRTSLSQRNVGTFASNGDLRRMNSDCHSHSFAR